MIRRESHLSNSIGVLPALAAQLKGFIPHKWVLCIFLMDLHRVVVLLYREKYQDRAKRVVSEAIGSSRLRLARGAAVRAYAVE